MKKKWITFCFILVIVTFTGIMLYIRADNNLAVRNSFSNSWRKHYVVEEKSIAYVNTTPEKEQVTVLSEGQGYGMFIAPVGSYDYQTTPIGHLYLLRSRLCHRPRRRR